MLDYISSDSDNEYDDILGQTFFNKYTCVKKAKDHLVRFIKQFTAKKNML